MMSQIHTCIFACLLAMSGLTAWAGETHHSPYAGEQSRAIKSLSAKDVAELERGGGWGLAKAAELNGVPGPAHVLSLGDELGITRQQRSEIETIHAAMKQAAIRQGRRLIALERELDRAFAKEAIDESTLAGLLAKIARARGDLRFTHLLAHLETASVVSKEQVLKYNRLRGYAATTDFQPSGEHGSKVHPNHGDCH